MTKSIFSNDFYKEIDKNIPRVDIRQTVLTGPRDVNGRADFLQAGTGLQAITKDLSVDPLVLTFGDGFSRFGQRDRTIENDQALTWDALPASETSFLYVDLLSDGTLQTGHTVLEPIYSQARPSTPATGQSFYPISHAHRMEFFDGANWIKRLRIFVGECVTNATDVTSAISYAFKGYYLSDALFVSANSSATLQHNLGLDFYDFKLSSIGNMRYALGSGYSPSVRLIFSNSSFGGGTGTSGAKYGYDGIALNRNQSRIRTYRVSDISAKKLLVIRSF